MALALFAPCNLDGFHHTSPNGWCTLVDGLQVDKESCVRIRTMGSNLVIHSTSAVTDKLHQHLKAKSSSDVPAATTTPVLPASSSLLSTRPLSLASPDVQGGITEDAFRIIPVPDSEVSASRS